MAFKRVFSERLETEGDWEREGIEFRERGDLDFLGEYFGLVAEERDSWYLSIIDRVALPTGRSE